MKLVKPELKSKSKRSTSLMPTLKIKLQDTQMYMCCTYKLTSKSVAIKEVGYDSLHAGRTETRSGPDVARGTYFAQV